jgi:hypothetical protein
LTHHYCGWSVKALWPYFALSFGEFPYTCSRYFMGQADMLTHLINIVLKNGNGFFGWAVNGTPVGKHVSQHSYPLIIVTSASAGLLNQCAELLDRLAWITGFANPPGECATDEKQDCQFRMLQSIGIGEQAFQQPYSGCRVTRLADAPGML